MTKLTENMVITRTKESNMERITKLSCWGNDLTDISVLKNLKNVEILALSLNQISTLRPFRHCRRLQQLYLRQNQISDLGELIHLRGLAELRVLWLSENPCVQIAGPNYRSTVIQYLPQLDKLDDVEVTPQELELAMAGDMPAGLATLNETLRSRSPSPNKFVRRPPTTTAIDNSTTATAEMPQTTRQLRQCHNVQHSDINLAENYAHAYHNPPRCSPMHSPTRNLGMRRSPMRSSSRTFKRNISPTSSSMAKNRLSERAKNTLRNSTSNHDLMESYCVGCQGLASKKNDKIFLAISSLLNELDTKQLGEMFELVKNKMEQENNLNNL